MWVDGGKDLPKVYSRKRALVLVQRFCTGYVVVFWQNLPFTVAITKHYEGFSPLKGIYDLYTKV